MTYSNEEASVPETYWTGQELDWQAAAIPVVLRVELPYWLMVPNCSIEVKINDHTFPIDIRDDYIELYVRAVKDSKNTCVYIGPPNKTINPELKELIEETKSTVLNRKCKTTLLVHSNCNKDVLSAYREGGKRKRVSIFYLKSFCEAHFEVINHLIQQYRLSTYDLFSYELSPWDIPIWFVGSPDGATVILEDYAAFDFKPVIFTSSDNKKGDTLKHIEPKDLQFSISDSPSAGELELIDALNLMERGDYSGAVRRITTAIEAQLEFVLRQELLKTYPTDEVERKLKASQNDFPGRLRQYLKLSGRIFSDDLDKELARTRELRHSIVHKGLRISFHDKGKAQRAVDTGRWIFNWIEDNLEKFNLRERKIVKRSLGRHYKFFDAEITSSGVVVHKPTSFV